MRKLVAGLMLGASELLSAEKAPIATDTNKPIVILGVAISNPFNAGSKPGLSRSRSCSPAPQSARLCVPPMARIQLLKNRGKPERIFGKCFNPTPDPKNRRPQKQENFSGCRVLSYCVMSNHFHILLCVPAMPEGGISNAELLERLSAICGDGFVADVAKELEAARKDGDRARVGDQARRCGQIQDALG